MARFVEQTQNLFMKINFLKLGFFLSLFFLASSMAFGQNARETTKEIDGQIKPAFTAEYAYSKSLVMQTLAEKLKKETSTKGAKFKGFIKYQAVVVSALTSNKIDVYTKVEGKNKKPMVTMMVSTGYDNFVGANNDTVLAQNAIAFLNQLKNDVQTVLDLEAQKAAVKEAEEKLKKAEKEKAKLAREKAKLEEKMVKEQKAAEKAGLKVDAERNKLDGLKSPDNNNSGGR